MRPIVYYIILYQEWIYPSISNKFLKNPLPKFLPTRKCSQICFHENPDLASNPSKIKAIESYKESHPYKLWEGGRICDPWGWTEPLKPIALDFEVAWLVEVKKKKISLLQEGRRQSRRKKNKYIFITLNRWASLVREKLSHFGDNLPLDIFLLAPGVSTFSYHHTTKHKRVVEQCLREP